MDNKKLILDSLNVCFPVIKPVEIWCLQDSKGHVLKLLSGKSKWNTQGHAKIALHNHIRSIFWNMRKHLTSEEISEMIQQLLDSRDLQIIRVFPEEKKEGVVK